MLDEHLNDDDALNIIYFADEATVLALSMGSHTAAVTKLIVETQPGCQEFFDGNPNDYTIKYPIAKDSYIAVNQDLEWYDKNSGTFIDSDETDLYTTLLHEIGHALGLNHALDPAQGTNDSRAMYPFVPEGNDNKHAIDAGDDAGGEYLAQKSRELLQSPNLLTVVCINDYSVNDDKFCTLTDVSNIFQKVESFIVTPNVCRVNQQIFVKSGISQSADFVVSNALGTKIRSFQLAPNATAELEFQSSGIFFISASHQGQLFTQKIIVQQ